MKPSVLTQGLVAVLSASITGVAAGCYDTGIEWGSEIENYASDYAKWLCYNTNYEYVYATLSLDQLLAH